MAKMIAQKLYQLICLPPGVFFNGEISILNILGYSAEEAMVTAKKAAPGKNLQLVGFSDAEAFIEKMKLEPTIGGPAETWYKKPVEPLVEPLSKIDYNSKTTKQIEYLCKYLKSKGYKITKPSKAKE